MIPKRNIFLTRTFRLHQACPFYGRWLICPERHFVAVDRNGRDLFSVSYCPN